MSEKQTMTIVLKNRTSFTVKDALGSLEDWMKSLDKDWLIVKATNGETVIKVSEISYVHMGPYEEKSD